MKPVIFVIALVIFSCVDKSLVDLARVKADRIVEHLGDDDAYKYFPEEYFSQSEIRDYFRGFGSNCEYQNRKGKFIDSYYQSVNNDTDKVSFIYEYFLKCDSLRIILKFNLRKDPEFTAFRIEPIEQKNLMVVDPKKSLIYEKR